MYYIRVITAVLLLAVVSGQLRDRNSARNKARRKELERERNERNLVNSINQQANRKRPSGSQRNNKCRNFQLCRAILANGRQNADERQILLESNPEAANSLSNNSILASDCSLFKPDCTSIDTNYRTPNGTCNNLKQPLHGSIFLPFKRILSPDYSFGDGLKNGVNPRKISRQMGSLNTPNSNTLNVMVMQWGQFLDHDITHTPTTTLFDENGNAADLNCCDNGVSHDECAPIPISSSDPVFTFSCMNFIRSASASKIANGNCVLGQREQFNQITSVIDASNVYGSDEASTNSLRGSDGKLKISTRNSKSYLPNDSENTCGAFSCYRAGDGRANVQVDLTVLHTVFMREHNQIAQRIKSIRPTWSSDKIFSETRKIVAAEMQMIAYNEYLPVILGRSYANSNGVSMSTTTKYNPNVSPNIYNEFATAAFRFGHSQIPDWFLRVGSGRVSLSESFFDTTILHSQGDPVREMSMGLIQERSKQVDRYFTSEITNNLFREGNTAFDLIALNIQRGRDHGLPSYKAYKDHYRQNLNSDLGSSRSKLINIYGSSDKIDLFIGGVSEKIASGAAVGPLFQEIIKNQFKDLREGDRFFFDNKRHYTSVAIKELKKVRLADIMCRNADWSGDVPEFVMTNSGSSQINCEQRRQQGGVNINLSGFFSSSGGPVVPPPPPTRPPRPGGRRRGGSGRHSRRRPG